MACDIYNPSSIFSFDTDFESYDVSENIYDRAKTIVNGKARLTSILDKPLINALVQVMLTPVVDVEQSACDLLNNRWIETAVGVQLDGCGYIVGEKRLGRNDDDYREAILFRVFVNTSNGTPENLITAIKFLTKGDDVQYIEQYPATSIIYTNGYQVPTDIAEFMQGLAPAGVSNLPILFDYSRKDPFRMGKETPLSEMFVDNDANYITLDDSDWQVSNSDSVQGSRLGGVVPDDFFIDGDFYLELDGGIFALNHDNNSVLFDSGSHLTGLHTT